MSDKSWVRMRFFPVLGTDTSVDFLSSTLLNFVSQRMCGREITVFLIPSHSECCLMSHLTRQMLSTFASATPLAIPKQTTSLPFLSSKRYLERSPLSHRWVTLRSFHCLCSFKHKLRTVVSPTEAICCESAFLSYVESGAISRFRRRYSCNRIFIT